MIPAPVALGIEVASAVVAVFAAVAASAIATRRYVPRVGIEATRRRVVAVRALAIPTAVGVPIAGVIAFAIGLGSLTRHDVPSSSGILVVSSAVASVILAVVTVAARPSVRAPAAAPPWIDLSVDWSLFWEYFPAEKRKVRRLALLVALLLVGTALVGAAIVMVASSLPENPPDATPIVLMSAILLGLLAVILAASAAILATRGRVAPSDAELRNVASARDWVSRGSTGVPPGLDAGHWDWAVHRARRAVTTSVPIYTALGIVLGLVIIGQLAVLVALTVYLAGR